MISESSIINASNDELRKLFLNYSIECGPIQDSTRSVYQKKLIKHLKSLGTLEKHTIIPGLSKSQIKMDLNNNETYSSLIEHHTVGSQTSFDSLNNLSDNELMERLKKYGYNLVPVNASTRNIYIKKLQKCLETPIQILEDNYDDDVNEIVQVKSEPYIQRASKIQPDIQIIEDDYSSTYRQLPTSTLNSNEERISNIYPKLKTNEPVLEPLEFRLIKPQQINKSVRYEQENMQPSKHVYPSSSFNPTTTTATSTTTTTTTTPNYYSNYENNQNIFATNLRDRNRPMINLTSLFDKKPINNEYGKNLQGPFVRNNIRQGIYDEPAPPQPSHLNKTNDKSQLLDTIKQWKYSILILLAFIFILFILTSISPDVKNPIEKF